MPPPGTRSHTTPGVTRIGAGWIPTAERENLAHGIGAMRRIGLPPSGFRPPGGLLNEGSLALLGECGLEYCSPAGRGAGIDGVVLLPFAWPAVDAYHVLPTFAALRRHVSGSEDAGGPDAVRDSLLAAVDEASATGGYACLVLHTWLIEAEIDAVREVLARVSEGDANGELWAARCDEVASWIASRAGDFSDPPRVDRTSWMQPS